MPPLVIPPKLADCGRLVNDLEEDILEKYGIKERPAAERVRDYLPRLSIRKSIEAAVGFGSICAISGRTNGELTHSARPSGLSSPSVMGR